MLPVNRRVVTKSNQNKRCISVLRYGVRYSEKGSIPGTVVWKKLAGGISAYKGHVGPIVPRGETVFVCNVWKV